MEGCQSKKSLRDVQKRKYSSAVDLSLVHVQFFRGKNKREKKVNKKLILGCGKHNVTAEQVDRVVKAPLVKHILQ